MRESQQLGPLGPAGVESCSGGSVASEQRGGQRRQRGDGAMQQRATEHCTGDAGRPQQAASKLAGAYRVAAGLKRRCDTAWHAAAHGDRQRAPHHGPRLGPRPGRCRPRFAGGRRRCSSSGSL